MKKELLELLSELKNYFSNVCFRFLAIVKINSGKPLAFSHSPASLSLSRTAKTMMVMRTGHQLPTSLLSVLSGLCSGCLGSLTMPWTIWISSVRLRVSRIPDSVFFLGESRAELGPGLATNYWFGFLKILLQSSDENHIRSKIDKYCSSCYPTNYEVYGKIILFLQHDCNFNHNTKRMEVR